MNLESIFIKNIEQSKLEKPNVDISILSSSDNKFDVEQEQLEQVHGDSESELDVDV